MQSSLPPAGELIGYISILGSLVIGALGLRAQTDIPKINATVSSLTALTEALQTEVDIERKERKALWEALVQERKDREALRKELDAERELREDLQEQLDKERRLREQLQSSLQQRDALIQELRDELARQTAGGGNA